MRDGSDAIADWPILNALINAVNGASWVSFHHGGGVGIAKTYSVDEFGKVAGEQNIMKEVLRESSGNPEAIQWQSLGNSKAIRDNPWTILK